MNELTQNILHELLSFDGETGVFRWKERSRDRFKSDRHWNSWNAKNAGKVAGSVGPQGYRAIKIEGRFYKAHRLAWMYSQGSFPVEGIDHINGDRDDNRTCNLRKATHSENLQNQRAARIDNASCDLLGVGFHKASGRWRARICIDGIQHHLGLFDTAEQAGAAYVAAKLEFHPFSTQEAV